MQESIYIEIQGWTEDQKREVREYVKRNKHEKDFGKFPVAFNYCEENEYRVYCSDLLTVADELDSETNAEFNVAEALDKLDMMSEDEAKEWIAELDKEEARALVECLMGKIRLENGIQPKD